MKRVFSVPPTQAPTESTAGAAEPASTPSAEMPPAGRPRPSIYVREVTERHRSAIERIFAQVRSRLSDSNPPTPPGNP